MENYKFDYNKKSFKVEKKDHKKNYFIKIKDKYINVSEDVYKVCKGSYDKIRYIYKQEVAKSVIYYEDIDSATFFVNERQSIEEQTQNKEIIELIIEEINLLPDLDKKIAQCVFLNEFSERKTGELLNIPKSTVSYRKNIIRKKILKNVKKHLGN